MARYAASTPVPVNRSRDELHRTLARYGCDETLIHEAPGRIRVGFVYQGLRIAFPLDLPVPGDFPTQAAFERELRRRWRVLILVLKGRLESVEEGAETAERAFLPYLLLPDGVTTVADEAVPLVREAYRTGRMPDSLLPGLAPAPKVIALPERGAGT